MTLLTNSFEGGTNGTTITAANSGGGSGNAFDVVTAPPAAGTLAFSNTHAAHGSLSCGVGLGATTGTPQLEWSTSMGTQTQAWFRQYLFFAANPAEQVATVRFKSGATLCASVQISAGGLIITSNSSGTTIFTMATSLPTNAWFRLEGFFLLSTTVGQSELKIFTSADSSTATETKTSAATQNLGAASANGYFYGITNTSDINISTFWMDDLGLSSTGYVGPAASAAVNAGLLPVLIP